MTWQSSLLKCNNHFATIKSELNVFVLVNNCNETNSLSVWSDTRTLHVELYMHVTKHVVKCAYHTLKYTRVSLGALSGTHVLPGEFCTHFIKWQVHASPFMSSSLGGSCINQFLCSSCMIVCFAYWLVTAIKLLYYVIT